MDVLDPAYWQADLAAVSTGHAEFLALQNQHLTLTLGGLTFDCPPTVYKPTPFSSSVFTLKAALKQLARQPAATILELGAGSGAVSISLASPGRQVTACDIDSVAIDAMTRNAAANHRDIEILQGDLFTPVSSRRFDLIIFNVPLLDAPVIDPAEIVACDPGGRLTAAYLKSLPYHLAPGGTGLIVTSNIGNRAALADGLAFHDHSVLLAEYSGDSREWRWVLAISAD